MNMQKEQTLYSRNILNEIPKLSFQTLLFLFSFGLDTFIL